MKITFLIRSLQHGGAERQLVLLARELQKLGHVISVLVYYGGGPLEQELLNNNIKIIALGKKGRWDIFSFLRRIKAELNKDRPDVLYGFLTTSNLISALCRWWFPSLKIVWGLRASNMNLNHYDWSNRLFFLIEKRTSFLAHHIIANSEAGKQYAIQHRFSDKITVIPNGVDASRFQNDPLARRELREKWGINQNEKLIGMVARLDPMKDHITFLEMAAALKQRGSRYRFIFKGTGPKDYKSFLQKKSQELNISDDVIWIEDEVPTEKFYSALDLFCLSSAFGEGFSNVLGEAMACGVPCVATDVGDAAFILGEFGGIAPIRSPLLLADKVEELLNKSNKTQDQHSLEIRQRMIGCFSVEAMVQKTQSVLMNVLQNG